MVITLLRDACGPSMYVCLDPSPFNSHPYLDLLLVFTSLEPFQSVTLFHPPTPMKLRAELNHSA